MIAACQIEKNVSNSVYSRDLLHKMIERFYLGGIYNARTKRVIFWATEAELAWVLFPQERID